MSTDMTRLRSGSGFSRVLRLLSVAMLTAAAWVSTSDSLAAADEVPRFGLYGDTIWTVGDRNFCRGGIHVRLETLGGSPGHVLAHITPLGFEGGPCGAWVHANWSFIQDRVVYVFAGTGPGETVTMDLPTGSGPNQLVFNTTPLANTGISHFVWIP